MLNRASPISSFFRIIVSLALFKVFFAMSSVLLMAWKAEVARLHCVIVLDSRLLMLGVLTLVYTRWRGVLPRPHLANEWNLFLLKTKHCHCCFRSLLGWNTLTRSNIVYSHTLFQVHYDLLLLNNDRHFLICAVVMFILKRLFQKLYYSHYCHQLNSSHLKSQTVLTT